MKKNKMIIIIVVLTIVFIVAGLLLFKKNQEIEANSISIIEAFDTCAEATEIFYEDDKYVYSFPCIQSGFTYVKFPNGNKMLVTTALDEEKVTIDELIKAGLTIYKEAK